MYMYVKVKLHFVNLHDEHISNQFVDFLLIHVFKMLSLNT